MKYWLMKKYFVFGTKLNTNLMNVVKNYFYYNINDYLKL